MILSLGFRPFFLLAGLWAVCGPLLAFAMAALSLRVPTRFGTFAWHGHEMLFGYATAVLAGFLLTALPNWTGRTPLRGWRLFGLVLLWIAGRIAVACSAVTGVTAAAVIDVSFASVLAAIVAHEIVAARNWRNLLVVVVLILLATANAASHAALADVGSADGANRFAVALLVTIMMLVGGRIIPGFTRNWLVRQGARRLPAEFGAIDRVAMVVAVTALALWVAVPAAPGLYVVFALAGLTVLLRWARWRGTTTWREPLVWVLHLGYFWIPLGYALSALSAAGVAGAGTAALHAFTSGAVGTMTLAVMTRATLGHTGRDLRAGRGLFATYIFVTLGAAARVAAPLVDGAYEPLIWLAGGAWFAAFLLFLAICGPMLLAAPVPAASVRA